MKTLVLSNGQLKPMEIENTLDALKEIVGGYIEVPHISNKLYENGIDVVINDEGKLIDGFKKEIAVIEKASGRILDLIYGNCIFVSHDNDGNFKSLTDEQVHIVELFLNTIAVLNTNEEVRVLFI